MHGLTTTKLLGARIMGDSENSRTLPSIMQGNLLSTAERFLIGIAEGQTDDPDETVIRWEAWRRAHCDHLRLFNAKQQLESALFRSAVDVPAEVCIPNPSEPTTQIQVCEPADRASDYNSAMAAEEIAFAVEQRLAENLWSLPGGSMISAVAKLHCILSQGEPEPSSGEFPWPQIRSVLADLLMANPQNKRPH